MHHRQRVIYDYHSDSAQNLSADCMNRIAHIDIATQRPKQLGDKRSPERKQKPLVMRSPVGRANIQMNALICFAHAKRERRPVRPNARVSA